MAFGKNVIQKDLTFTINKGDVFIVMGGVVAEKAH